MLGYNKSLKFAYVILAMSFILDLSRATKGVLFTNRGICRIRQHNQDVTDYISLTSTSSSEINSLECAVLCAGDEECIGFNHPTNDSRGGCTLRWKSFYFQETQLARESHPDAECVFMQKRNICHNGGRWSGVCHCEVPLAIQQWVGEFCSSLPVACDDFYDAKYIMVTTEIRWDPFGDPLNAPTVCIFNLEKRQSKAIFASFEQTSNPDFHKSWEEMELGFDDLSSDSDSSSRWVGLEVMHRHVEKVKHKPRYLEVVFDSNSFVIFFRYHDVYISDSTDGYRLTFSDSTWDTTTDLTPSQMSKIPFCLREANGSRFSTYDNDNDEDDDNNCARMSQAGFWYSECHPMCHPLSVSFNSSSAIPFLFSGGYQNMPTSNYWAGSFQRTEIRLVVNN